MTALQQLIAFVLVLLATTGWIVALGWRSDVRTMREMVEGAYKLRDAAIRDRIRAEDALAKALAKKARSA